jgi:NAD(P)-dependent dehydrogenase (short-subunit alcohol dehydrogenase family)
MNRLAGKVALVTGAARGIGEAIARAFIAEGARVWITDIDDAAGRALAQALGPCAKYRHLDVREESEWTAVMQELVHGHGRLDVLVNNAGITGFEQGPVAHDPENGDLDAWRAVHRTNLDGVFLGCKHAIRAKRMADAGSIINISSRSGLVGIPGAAAYASSKAGVRNHTKTVALYCAEQGLKIRCNSIHPAAILDAHVGTPAGHRAGARGAHACLYRRLSAEALWNGRGGRGRGRAAGVRRSRVHDRERDQHRWRDSCRGGRIAQMTVARAWRLRDQ